jgi:hypothetical protein
MSGYQNRYVWRISEELLKYFRQDGGVYVSGQLRVVAGAIDFGPAKRVGLRYTLNDWANWKEVDGMWSKDCASSGTDEFVICTESTVLPGTLMRYAIYYVVNGTTYWDNNRSSDYSAQF